MVRTEKMVSERRHTAGDAAVDGLLAGAAGGVAMVPRVGVPRVFLQGRVPTSDHNSLGSSRDSCGRHRFFVGQQFRLFCSLRSVSLQATCAGSSLFSCIERLIEHEARNYGTLYRDDTTERAPVQYDLVRQAVEEMKRGRPPI